MWLRRAVLAAFVFQPPLLDVTATSGVDFVHRSGDPAMRTILTSLGGGVGLIDYDGDEDLDLYFVTRGRNRLYRNLGGFRFEDVTDESGVGHEGFGVGCAVADFDNDGLADLYVTNVGANALFRNRGDGTFEDVTSRVGGGDEGFGASAAFFDSDGDGDLDLYVANYVRPDQDFPPPGSGPTCLWLGLAVMCGPMGLEGQADNFYRNDGLRLVEATKESGLEDRIPAYGLGVVSADYDSDGDADLYVANDTNPNYLFRNDGTGRFEEVGLVSGAGYNASGATEAGMGVDFGDGNGDGYLDIFVTNFSHETNTLYLGSKGGFFTDSTEESGLGPPSLGRLGWGARFSDLDNDGDEDLFVANGHVYPNVESVDGTTSYFEPNQVYLNNGTGGFEEILLPGAGKSHRAAAFGDLDEDGDADVVVTAIDDAPTLLRNDFPRARYLGLRLVGRASNRDGFGARIDLVGPPSRTKEAHASGSVLSSSDPRVLFGLATKAEASEIRIRWPSGTETTLRSLSPDRYVVVVEGLSSTSP
jgi:hypothetical protein